MGAERPCGALPTWRGGAHGLVVSHASGGDQHVAAARASSAGRVDRAILARGRPADVMPSDHAELRHGWRAVACWRWVLLGLLVATLGVAALLSVDAAGDMARRDACELPAYQFEVESAETLDVQWLPPRVLCRYRYLPTVSETPSDEWESRWRVLAPLPIVLGVAALVNRNIRDSRRR